MRNYIFEFDQQIALRLGLKLNELLFLDYLAKFINSGSMRCKFIEGKRYYRLTYKKVMEDLPILKIKERQLRNIIISLENKGILQRYSELKNEMHIYPINKDYALSGELKESSLLQISLSKTYARICSKPLLEYLSKQFNITIIKKGYIRFPGRYDDNRKVIIVDMRGESK